MSEENYTSLNLSKWLAENGCEKDKQEEGFWWIKDQFEDIRLLHSSVIGQHNSCNPQKEHFVRLFFAYDLIWDVCIKFSKEFWGEKFLYDYDNLGEKINVFSWTYHTEKILSILQQNKKDEAEKYIMENNVF